MTAVAAWRGVFIERLKATGNITLAASGAGVARQHAYRTRNRSKAFRRYLRARGRRGEVVPLAEQRRRFVGLWHALIAEMAAA